MSGAGLVGYGPSGSSAPGTAEEIGFGTCRGERNGNAARDLDVTGGDFQETKTQRRELGSGQFAGFGNGVAYGEHQPISGGVEKDMDLIGERRTAARAIAGEGPMQHDRFSAWPRAQYRLS